MGKAIGARVRDSFGEGSVADLKEYADNILATWKDVSSSLSKSALLIFLLIAIFELLVYQTSKGFTISSFSFANTSVVQIALPSIIAYIMYDSILLTSRWLQLESAYTTITKIRAPKAEANDLDVLIRPYLPGFWNVGHSISDPNALPSDKFIFRVRKILGVLTVFIFPIAFQVQAYYRLYEKYNYHSVFLWINAAITMALVVFVIRYILLRSHEN